MIETRLLKRGFVDSMFIRLALDNPCSGRKVLMLETGMPPRHGSQHRAD